MSLIPADHLRALRNDVAVVAVISELGMPTRMCRRRLTFRCPQCGGFRTATYPRTNLACCFSCKRNFNTIELVMAQRASSFRDAVKYLENLVGASGVRHPWTAQADLATQRRKEVPTP